MQRKTDKQVRGQLGEDAVCEELKRRRHIILERNFHKSFGEIDIISRIDNFIVFTEVKTRQENTMVTGLEAVDLRKRRKIIKTADFYLCSVLTEEHSFQPRYDIAEVTITRTDNPTVVRIDILENAFSADELYTMY